MSLNNNLEIEKVQRKTTRIINSFHTGEKKKKVGWEFFTSVEKRLFTVEYVKAYKIMRVIGER